ncbi:Uncharacterised protein (plasmid) [Legionella adelaidensis]|uniref:Uncharacterized protein n=1 Tax=Legionella adelaidensis TaxID=45056 RepID=A0A0W0R0H1_9GAMM|nr:hypothetical protein [Legionella adelaidensis]KTC64577.1 hypothetical protein Lade_1871 [Legionella adelaidensis]VEH85945.1 Uncharacterised protein [Legionella adelaidensis]
MTGLPSSSRSPQLTDKANDDLQPVLFLLRLPSLFRHRKTMPSLEPTQEEELKSIVFAFLTGRDIAEIKVRLTIQCHESHINCKELYQAISLPGPSDDTLLKLIIRSLNLSADSIQTQQILSQSKNLYELLKYFAYDGNHQVKYLLNLIENAKVAKDWSEVFLFGTLFTALSGILLYFNKEAVKANFDKFCQWLKIACPTILDWLSRTFAILRNFQLLGIINTSLRLLWNWYSTFSNPTNSTSHKVSLLFFKTITAGLTIAGYCVSFFAGGVMTFPAASLFVLSASIELFKSLFIKLKTQQMFNSLPEPTRDDPWEIWSQYIRLKNLYNRSSETFWIWGASAFLTTVVVAISNFFPPNLIITITSLVIIPLIAWTKNSLVNSINERYARELQSDLRRIPKEKRPSDFIEEKQKLLQQRRDLESEFGKLEESRVALETEQTRLEQEKLSLQQEREQFEQDKERQLREIKRKEEDAKRENDDARLALHMVSQTLTALTTGTPPSKALENIQKTPQSAHRPRNAHSTPPSFDYTPLQQFSLFNSPTQVGDSPDSEEIIRSGAVPPPSDSPMGLPNEPGQTTSISPQ